MIETISNLIDNPLFFPLILMFGLVILTQFDNNRLARKLADYIPPDFAKAQLEKAKTEIANDGNPSNDWQIMLLNVLQEIAVKKPGQENPMQVGGTMKEGTPHNE